MYVYIWIMFRFFVWVYVFSAKPIAIKSSQFWAKLTFWPALLSFLINTFRQIFLFDLIRPSFAFLQKIWKSGASTPTKLRLQAKANSANNLI